MTDIELRLLALLVPLFASLIVGIYKSASIRANHMATWSKRINTNKTILADIASEILRDIYNFVDRYLDTDNEFRRDIKPLDPTHLESQIRDFLQVIKLQKRIARDFSVLMYVGPTIIVALSLGICCVIFFAVNVISANESHYLLIVMYIIAIFAGVCMTVALGLNALLQHRLTSTELFCERKQS
ncbi:MAG: hypothetical protein OXI96_03450 [Acidimicrobiaceae bacterium]|nr:hypothetical protein [Acidimicrobiaceae bacterium]